MDLVVLALPVLRRRLAPLHVVQRSGTDPGEGAGERDVAFKRCERHFRIVLLQGGEILLRARYLAIEAATCQTDAGYEHQRHCAHEVTGDSRHDNLRPSQGLCP